MTAILCGCQKQTNSDNDTENSIDQNEYKHRIEVLAVIPDIESFSDKEYEDYAKDLSEIISAYYISDGIKTELKNNDERLYRLLNFIIKSDKQLTTVYETRGINSDEIQNIWYDDPSPMLEINFLGSEKGTTLSGIFQILVRGSGVVYIYHSGHPDLFGESGICGEQKWPYLGNVEAEYWDSYTNPKQGEQPWLDLLKLAGF